MNNKDFLCEDIVLESISIKDRRILDFGCGNGIFTEKLYSKNRVVFGCDADISAIQSAKEKSKNVKYTLIPVNGITPYRSNFFDCITMMGVLEHVVDESETLQEIHRVLKKGGSLYIYGLNKGLFGFLDTGNIKFRFPYLHKILYKFFFNENEYKKEFVLKKKHGIFGDITVGKNWHSHYSKQDLEQFLGNKFKLKKHWLYSFTLPIILAIDFVYTSFFKKESKFIIELARFDQKINIGNLSYSFVIKCEKR
ncbi:MAG: class I SAM-dependent methyltransferase [Candidatus Woesearchaeota archaeon]|jgi:ubiquinone/menaquinone biosynthesis C-methylase UbiE